MSACSAISEITGWDRPSWDSRQAKESFRQATDIERQRHFAHQANPDARLHSHENLQRAGVDSNDLRRQEPTRPKTQRAYSDSFRKQTVPTQNVANANQSELVQAGVDESTLSTRVSYSFRDRPILFFTEQIFSGVLGANYIIADEMEGRVNFVTERPVTKLETLELARNILAAKGYVVKQINGVFQIGLPETVAAIQLNSSRGEAVDLASRVIPVQKGSAAKLAEVVGAVLPPGSIVTANEATNSLILRMKRQDMNDAIELVDNLLNSGVADDLVAVIPLNETAPELVSAQLLEFFSQSPNTSVGIPIVVPLTSQQSLLVGAKDQFAMSKIRSLVQSLDRDLRDSVTLRIIPLSHVPAAEMAGQLNAIFNGASGGPLPADNQAAQSGNRSGGDRNSGGDSVRTPAAIRGNSSSDRSGGSQGGRGGASLARNIEIPSGQVSIVADERNNALLVRTTFKQFKRIAEVVKRLDLPLSQVVIEATIAEVQLNDNLGYGVQWFLSRSGISLRSSKSTSTADPGNAGGAGVISQLLGGTSISVILTALQEVTDVNVISSPYLTVMDRKTARLSIGDQIPFVTSKTETGDAGSSSVKTEVTSKDTGVIMEVTPRIRADNSVLLNISQIISQASTVAAGSALNPTIQQRSVNSDIIVDSGDTVLLGGLIQDRESKTDSGVPLLRNLRYVGGAFNQKDTSRSRTELLIMITPRVARRSSELQAIGRHLQQHLKRRYLNCDNQGCNR